MDRGAWRATVHEVVKSWTQLSNFHTQAYSLIEMTSLVEMKIISGHFSSSWRRK